jgi:hypothetical protein
VCAFDAISISADVPGAAHVHWRSASTASRIIVRSFD